MVSEFSSGIITWLFQQYEKSKSYQMAKGIIFNLSFLEYQSLWQCQSKKLNYWYGSGKLDTFMRHPQQGLVLSWRSKELRAAGVMDATTACVITRANSEKRFFLQAGEQHTEEAKKRIGDGQRGRKRSDKHKAAISRARKGQPQSKEQIAKRVAATRATKERNRLLAS